MKILRIQGKNLAAIAGEFDIDFRTEPLRSSGIFAICGPTGSGKSTLLDAVCLALFNNTPRTTGIEGTKMPDVGSELIQQGDRRQILRRGCTEAMAAVEFIAVNGKNYRSVWRVWRANNKVDGKLQPAELRIYDLHTNTPITTGITEAENKLVQLIGLNYNQFTRTVLLAQNEFSRFLKARKEEKAEVLEKLTGTGIYSVISNTVYTKTAAIRSEWKELSNRIENIRLLTPEEMSVLHREIQDLGQKEKSLQQKNEIIQFKIKWFQQLAHIEKSKEEALSLLRESQRLQSEALPKTIWLQHAEAVESSRMICREKTECTEQIEIQGKILRETEQLLSELSQKTARSIRIADRQKLLVNKYTDDYNNIKPELLEARRLDIEITNAFRTEQESRKALNDLREKMKQQQDIQESRGIQIVRLKEQQDKINEWFASNRQHEQMCLNINLIEGFLDNAYTIGQQITANESALADLHRQLLSNRSLLETILQTADKYTRQNSLLNQQRQQYQEMIASIPIAGIRQKKDNLRVFREGLMQKITLAEKFEKNQKEQDDRKDKLRQLHQALKSAEMQLVQCRKDKEVTEIQYTTLRRSAEQARLTLSESVTQLRSQLEKDTPCPVCGSLTHPYGEHQPLADNMLRSLEKEVRQYEIEYERLKTIHTRLETEQQHLSQNRIVLQQELEVLSKEGELLRMQARRLSSKPETDTGLEADALKKQLDTSLHELEELRQKEQEWEKLQNFIASLQKNLDELQLKTETAQKEVRIVEEKTVRTSAEQAKLKDIIENLRIQKQDSLNKVSPYINSTNWRQHWEVNHLDFKRELALAAQKWKDKSKQLEENQKFLLQLTTEYAENRKNLEALQTNETELILLLKERSAETQSLKQQRSRLLQGQTAESTEQYWQQLLEKSSRELENTLQQKEQLLSESEQLRGKNNQLRITVEQYRQRLEKSAGELQEWLNKYNRKASIQLTETTLISLLQVPVEEIQAERERQNRLRDQVTTAFATLQEREKQWAIHTQQPGQPDPETESLLSLQTQLTELQQETDRLLQLKTEALAKLHTQKENQKQADSLGTILEEKALLLNKWSKLDELIGSQSGYKFKEIAQGYTLDILLSYANKQLRELTPRYQLQRIPDELALQVIDHDLCDEARSVFSLSGGESFLVSLALALGLSSFSSRNHFEENLFIDEGFGTLDTETLQIVMEALERLRSQGRQVGIISHVRELTERIPVKICLVKTGNGKSKVVLEC